MSMMEWAKREVEIASKRERGDKPESEWDYGCACYDSALKAFESLCGDGHSGFSIGITKGILNRLIEGKPLTPIEDTEDVWNVCSRGENGGVATYQCKRMSSLFKDVYPDGTVKYHDNDRYYCIKWDDPNLCWHNGFIGKIYSKMFPLTMPYMPSNKADVIVCDELLTDRKNGDFDTLAVLSTGAYNYSMASNYNRIGKPAVVMVRNGEPRIVVKRETYADLVRNDI